MRKEKKKKKRRKKTNKQKGCGEGDILFRSTKAILSRLCNFLELQKGVTDVFVPSSCEIACGGTDEYNHDKKNK